MAQGETIIVRRKRAGKHGPHHGGAWKIAYADFVTAMMAFFMLLWLISNANKLSLAGLAEYFSVSPAAVKTTTGADGVMTGEATGEAGTSSSGAPSPGLRVDPAPNAEQRQSGDSSGRGEAQRPDATMRIIAEELRVTLSESPDVAPMRQQISVSPERDGIRIQLMDSARRPMFRTGTDDIYPYARAALATITRQLLRGSQRLVIEGHTDGTGGYEGNWRLSGARAQKARQVMMEEGMGADRIAEVVALAGNAPLFPGEPDRPENRRITLVLMSEPAAFPQDMDFRR